MDQVGRRIQTRNSQKEIPQEKIESECFEFFT